MSVSSVNDELEKCWPPFREIFAQAVRDAVGQGFGELKTPAFDLRIEDGPQFTAIPTWGQGGPLELSLPGPGKTWRLTIAGLVSAPGIPNFGQRRVQLEISDFKLKVSVDLTAPSGGDPRPRIANQQSFKLEPTGTITLDVENAVQVSSSFVATSGDILFGIEAKANVTDLGGLAFPVFAKIHYPSEEGNAEVDLRLGPFVARTEIAMALDALKALKVEGVLGGLPVDWPPPGSTQPTTPITGEAVLSYAQLQQAALDTRAAVENAASGSQVEGLIFDRFTHTDGNRAFTGDEDTAIWTGHLLAADALAGNDARAAQTLKGIKRLLDVPQAFATTDGTIPDDPTIKALFPRDLFETDGLFARSVLSAANAQRVHKHFDDAQDGPRPPEDTEKLPWGETAYYRKIDAPGGSTSHYAHGRDQHGPTRDSLMGITLGLACVLRFSTNVTLVQDAGRIAARIAKRLDRNGWALLTPRGRIDQGPQPRRYGTARDTLAFHWAMQLAVMRVAATADPTNFGARYDELAAAYIDESWLLPWIDSLDTREKLFPLNLEHAAYTTLMLLEPANTNRRSKYARLGELFRAAIGHHGNVHFDLLHLLATYDATALGQTPANPKPYYGEATLKDGMVHALSDVVGRTAVPGQLPTQSNPLHGEQGYLTGRVGQAAYFEPVGGNKAKALFPVPPSRRPGNHLDFGWQRGPFATLTGTNYPADRASVTSPAIDLILPAAALDRLGKAPQVIQNGQPSGALPPLGSFVKFGNAKVHNTTRDLLKGWADKVTVAQKVFFDFGADPNPSVFLQQRLRRLTEGPNASKLPIAMDQYPTRQVGPGDLGTLMLDVVFLLEGDPRFAEEQILEAFLPTLITVWGNAGKLFFIGGGSRKKERYVELLAAKVGTVLPDGRAAQLGANLLQSGALNKIGAPVAPFGDPDESFGLALRRLFHVDTLR